MGRTTRKLEVWTFHAHLPDGREVDYRQLFLDLRALRRQERQERLRGRQIAIPTVSVKRGGYATLQAYEGEPDVQPLIYDTSDGSERFADTSNTEVVVTKTHARFDFVSREAIVEFNLRGAKASDIADVIAASLARENRWPGLTFELAPQVDASFVEELDSFERIRQVEIRMTRPNYDWTDVETELTKLAGDSDAGAVEVQVSAPRGQSLSKSGGLVRTVRQLAAAPKATIKNAVVRGRRSGEADETTVTLTNHRAHQKVRVATDERGQVLDEEIETTIADYAKSRRGDAT